MEQDAARTIIQKTDCFQTAWLLREKLKDLVVGVKPREFVIPEAELLDMAASLDIVSVDPEMLNPVIWSTLPKELKFHVLARLLVPDITRLRSLSRQWKIDLATANSDSNRACDEASPSTIALLSHSRKDMYFVTMYDVTKCKWQYVYRLHLRKPRKDGWEHFWSYKWTQVSACGGGLVCFLYLRRPSKHDPYPLWIVMVNLLTQVQRQLPPPHYQYSSVLKMVHFKVDSDTRCCKVFVVADVKGCLTVEIYDSGTSHWTGAAPSPSGGSIFGSVNEWPHRSVENGWGVKFHSTPGSYNFEQGKLEHYIWKDSPSTEQPVIDSVFSEKGLMFVLQQMGHGFYITSYHLENQTTKAWVQGKSYDALHLLRIHYPLRSFPP